MKEKIKRFKRKRNLALFVHGGGFIGGDVKTKGNQCRYLAQQSGAVVVSPEYRLAPETHIQESGRRRTWNDRLVRR